MRDLVRARDAMLADRKRAQQRLTAVLMRHGRIWRGATYWTRRTGRGSPRSGSASRRWPRRSGITGPRWPSGRRSWPRSRPSWCRGRPASRWPGPVARLGCYRGIAELGGLTLAAEVVDWRRFPAARAFMSYTGLVPAEYSSGERTRRGHITKAGLRAGAHRADRGRLGLPVPAPAIGAGLRRRQARRRPGHPGPVVEGAAPAARPVRAPGARRREGRAGGRRGGRPRAGRVRLGRDDRLAPGR